MVKLYKTRTCGVCVTVAKFLTSKGVKFEEIFVDNDFDTRLMLQQKTGATTVPQTVIGDNIIVGWNPGAFVKALSAYGQS